jgi:hypothetical protein
MPRYKKGISLIEALVSLVILMMGISAVTSIILRSAGSARDVDLRAKTERVATNLVETYWADGGNLKSLKLSNKLAEQYTQTFSNQKNGQLISFTLILKSNAEITAKRTLFIRNSSKDSEEIKVLINDSKDKDKNDLGHGNDADGIDESNPEKSQTQLENLDSGSKDERNQSRGKNK